MNAPSIIVEDVHVSFPLVRNRARGVKEAFLSWFRSHKGADAPAKEFWALKGVSFEVEKGQVLGIVGRNGSGKSTLLRVIAEVYAAEKGRVWVDAKRISALLELGSGFREELTGLENIRLSGAIMGLSPKEIDSRREDIIEFAGIREFIGQPLRTYSSGMRARLGFAVASSIEPEVLLIDEVLAVGDRDFRERSMKRIEELVGGETTVVIVSHNAQELRRLCDRVVWLESGLVREAGPAAEVLDQYESS